MRICQSDAVRNRRVLVTGSSRGIGRAIAERLARDGWSVALHYAENRAEAERVVASIGPRSQGLYQADLANPAEATRLFQAALADGPIHALVNNAGVYRQMSFADAGDGEFEATLHKTFAVNFESPMRLCRAAVKAFAATGGGRILNVASSAHANGVVELDDLEQAKQYDMPGHPLKGWQAYCNTKLMNVLFTYELARRLEGTDVTVNCLHPGQIATELIRTSPTIFKLFYRMIMPGPERGARTSIYLASSSEVQTVTGQYFDHNQKAVPSSPASHDEAVAQRLWLASEQYTKLSAPSGNQRPVLASV